MGFNIGKILGAGKLIPGIGTAFGIAEGAYSLFSGLKQNSLANKINPDWKPREISPYAKKQLGIAQQMFNGRMAGATAAENNIMGNQATQIDNINSNATDSATALSLATGTQGATNQAFGELAVREAQNKESLLSNLNDAYKTMTGEEDKNYQNNILNKYQMDVADKTALRGAGATNTFNGLDRLGTAFMQSGMFGGRSAGGYTYNRGNKPFGAIKFRTR